MSFAVPNVPAGQYTIRVCNFPNIDLAPPIPCSSQDSATAVFTVLAPVVNLSRSSGVSGATFNVSGSRFLPNRALHLYFGPPGNPKLHEISPGTPKQTNSDGVFGSYTLHPPMRPATTS